MLKKLFLMTAALLMSGPAVADPNFTPRSMDGLGCIMLRECTDGVQQVWSVHDLVRLMPDNNYSENKEEMENLFAALGDAGVKVFIADEIYFPPRHRGIYDVKNNYFFLNKDYVWDEGHLVGVMRHEGWHAAQDCMAGTIDNTFTAVILQDGVVPQYIIDTVARTYPPKPRPWENEAFYAATVPNLTVEAVRSCASNTPMWETYEPTPLTRAWLTEQGYIK